MTIGGHDITFRTGPSSQVAEGVIRITRASWQASLMENADTGEQISIGVADIRELPREVFIYKDAAARNSWALEGAIPENANLMLHIIRGADTLTLVVDDPNTLEMSALIDSIGDYVRQEIFWTRAHAA